MPAIPPLKLPHSPAEIVYKAWKHTGLTQCEFAEKYGIRQYNLSRYKSGKVAPPDDLLMHCMHILGMISPDDVSLEELVDAIRRNLSRPDQATLRKAVYELVSSFT